MRGFLDDVRGWVKTTGAVEKPTKDRLTLPSRYRFTGYGKGRTVGDKRRKYSLLR